MFVGMTPSLHCLLDTEPFASVATAISIAGGCAVPGSLLLLGASLAGNSITTAPGGLQRVVRVRDAAQQTRSRHRAVNMKSARGVLDDGLVGHDEDDETDDFCVLSESFARCGDMSHEKSESDDHRGHLQSNHGSCSTASFTNDKESLNGDAAIRQQRHAATSSSSPLSPATDVAKGEEASIASVKRNRGRVDEVVASSSAVDRASLRATHLLDESIRYARFLFDLTGVERSFVFGIAAVRLLLVPAVSFSLVRLMSASKLFPSIADPYHNTMLVTVLILCASPSSITIVMMSNVQQFMVLPVAKMLFYQYFLTIPACMLWLTLALWMAS
jgi:hypothetical protein